MIKNQIDLHGIRTSDDLTILNFGIAGRHAKGGREERAFRPNAHGPLTADMLEGPR